MSKVVRDDIVADVYADYRRALQRSDDRAAFRRAAWLFLAAVALCFVLLYSFGVL